MRNNRISSKRSPVERFYAFIKCVCKAGRVAVTTVARVRVRMMITGIVFNIYHLARPKAKCWLSISCGKIMANRENDGFRRQELKKLE